MKKSYVLTFYGRPSGFTSMLLVLALWPSFSFRTSQFAGLQTRRHLQLEGRTCIRFLGTVHKHQEFHSFSRHRLLIHNLHSVFSFSCSFGFFLAICQAFWLGLIWSLQFIWECLVKVIVQLFIFIRAFMSVGSFAFTLLDQIYRFFWCWLFTFWAS